MADSFVPGSGHVLIPHLILRDDLEAVVTCWVRRPGAGALVIGTSGGKEGIESKETERVEKEAPLGETLTVPWPSRGAVATQNIFCALRSRGIESASRMERPDLRRDEEWQPGLAGLT